MAEATIDWIQRMENEAERMPKNVSFLFDVAQRVKDRDGKMGMVDAVRVGWGMPAYKEMFNGDRPDLITSAALSILEDAKPESKPKLWFFNLLMEQLPLLEESLASYHADGEKILVGKQLAFKTLLTLYDYGNDDTRRRVGGILEKHIDECQRLADVDTENSNHFLGFRVMQATENGEMAGVHRRKVIEVAVKDGGLQRIIDGTLGKAEHFQRGNVSGRIKSLVDILVLNGDWGNGKEMKKRSDAVDDMVKSWLTIKYDKPEEVGNIGDMSTLEYAVHNNIIVMNSLWREEGNESVFGVYQKYGITHFGRYHPDLLLRQWRERETNELPFGVHVGCYADWNGAFYKDMSLLSDFDASARQVGRRVIFVEARSKLSCTRRLQEQYRKYKREIDFLVLAGHGMQTALALGRGVRDQDYIYLSDLKSKATDKIKKIYRKNIPILFNSCSVGAKDGLAHGFSQKLDGQGIGPDVPSSVQSFKLGLDLDGRSDFYDVVYSKANAADYRSGTRVDKIRE